MTQIEQLIQKLIQTNLTDVIQQAAVAAAAEFAKHSEIRRPVDNSHPQLQLLDAPSSRAPQELRLATQEGRMLLPVTQPQSSTTALTTHGLIDGSSTRELPAQYVKAIQAGEFFDLAKLLPTYLQKLANVEGENVLLAIGNNKELKLSRVTRVTFFQRTLQCSY